MEWFEKNLLSRFAPVTVVALLIALVLIFVFQADYITSRYFHVFLIAIPILLQVYFNSGFAYGLMRVFPSSAFDYRIRGIDWCQHLSNS